MRAKMSLPEEISALETADQIVEWIFGLSDIELIDTLTRHELSVDGTKAEKYKGLKRLLLLIEGFRTGLQYRTSPPTLHRAIGTI